MLVAQQFYCPHCDGEGAGKALVSDCCGKVSNSEIFCRECENVCQFVVCPECGGEGTIEKDVEVESE